MSNLSALRRSAEACKLPSRQVTKLIRQRSRCQALQIMQEASREQVRRQEAAISRLHQRSRDCFRQLKAAAHSAQQTCVPSQDGELHTQPSASVPGETLAHMYNQCRHSKSFRESTSCIWQLWSHTPTNHGLHHQSKVHSCTVSPMYVMMT